MLYENSYLDAFSRALRGDEDALRDLLDVEKIPRMFEEDCRKLAEMLRSGRAEYDEVRRALNLLKSYVVSQLILHFEKAKEFAKSRGIDVSAELDPALVNEIALMINRFEKEL
ncbi:MAG: hypothetical protein ABWW66_00470 [Archaeoglobaceae archaeon]